MSVAAMTMDDQRPLLNNYDKMSKPYEQNLHHGGGGPSGPASPTPEEPTTSQSSNPFHQSSTSSHHHHSHHHHHSSHHHVHHSQQFHHRHQSSVVADTQSQKQTSTPPSPLLLPQQQALQPTVIAEAVAVAEQRQRLLEDEIESLKREQTHLTQQCADAQRREKILMRRLANKEQEFQDYVSQIAEYKAAQAPSALALRSALLDPAVNLLFEKLKKELKATKAKLEETQNELSAWKFTPDSNTGKRLMAKCRLLYQENEELGKMTSNGRLAKLETELAMQKSFSEEVKKSQSELDDFLQELDEDVEGMQSTILFLQQELKTTRDRIQVLEKENFQYKNGIINDAPKDEEDDIQLAQHIALNGGDNNAITTTEATNNTTAMPTYNNQQQIPIPATIIANSDKSKFQPTTALETIEENACLRNIQQNVTTCYNGIEAPIMSASSVIVVTATASDECSNSSNNKLRTAATRKRNYDSDSNENITAAVIAPVVAVVQVSAPRTLPPKKSKLRVMPARRTSVQSVDDNIVPQTLPEVALSIVDNAVAGMEELPLEEVDVAVGGGVAQRIMTRRRSVRTQQQQNGDSNH